MALVDHISILTHHALAEAQLNKLKPTKNAEFYAVIAFPPSAANDLAEIAQLAAGSEPLSKFEIGLSTNAKAKKPIAGIPPDWFVVRAASQYAPYVADATGTQLVQDDAAQRSAIKTSFYAGKKVRAHITAYVWNFQGKRGISFNIAGVMDAGTGGDRLNIGVGMIANAFQAYAEDVSVAGSKLQGSAQETEQATAQVPPWQASQVAQPNRNPFEQT